MKNYNSELEGLARQGRWLAISTVAKSGAGHVGGPFSAMDILTALFFRALRIDPQNPKWAARDRFILSKGHSSIGLYAVMALRGYFPIEELKTFDKGNSRLQGHPDVTKLPGLDTSTGSLGQGLSVGLGMALGSRLRGEKFHTFVMIGDGELQEGMVWEALHIAPRYKLGNLTAILLGMGCNNSVGSWPLTRSIVAIARILGRGLISGGYSSASVGVVWRLMDTISPRFSPLWKASKHQETPINLQ
jgi:transketolase N-terminal domain/subunit